MVDRHIRLVPETLVVLTLLVLVASGCASGGNTLAQELAWERWNKCNSFPGLRLNRIDSAGQIWVNYGDGFADLAPWRACLQSAAVEQAQRKTTSTPEAPRVVATVAPSPEPALPIWKPGDEWAYRWESPQGKGTFVWSVDREEAVDGATYYVIKSGTREVYYRKSDFAYYMDKLNGNVETRHVPPTAYLPWPPWPGAKVDVSFTRERLLERQTEQLAIRCESGSLEQVTVPAGTFDTVKVTCRNTQTNAVTMEMWVSAAVKNFVRQRTYFSYGVRERELIGLKLR
jgi:hypothetical protein